LRGAQLEVNDDATLERHCEVWEERHGARVSVATMSRAVRKLGWTYKKSPWRWGTYSSVLYH
jgi:transposase